MSKKLSNIFNKTIGDYFGTGSPRRKENLLNNFELQSPSPTTSASVLDTADLFLV